MNPNEKKDSSFVGQQPHSAARQAPSVLELHSSAAHEDEKVEFALQAGAASPHHEPSTFGQPSTTSRPFTTIDRQDDRVTDDQRQQQVKDPFVSQTPSFPKPLETSEANPQNNPRDILTFNLKIIRLNMNNEKFKLQSSELLSNSSFDFLKLAPFVFHQQDLKSELDDFSLMYLSFLKILITEKYDTRETIFNQALELLMKFHIEQDYRSLPFKEAILIFLNNENDIPSVLEEMSRKSLVVKKIITDLVISSRYSCNMSFFWNSEWNM
jgi:hypothetical protein